VGIEPARKNKKRIARAHDPMVTLSQNGYGTYFIYEGTMYPKVELMPAPYVLFCFYIDWIPCKNSATVAEFLHGAELRHAGGVGMARKLESSLTEKLNRTAAKPRGTNWLITPTPKNAVQKN